MLLGIGGLACRLMWRAGHGPGLVIALVVATGVVACGDAYRYHGTVLEPLRDAAPLRLVEHGGRVFDLRTQRGNVVLLYFGYAQCPDICPQTLANWASAQRELGSDAERVTFVFVSVDPARDTPAIVQTYARRFDSTFIGLTGDAERIAAIERDYMSTSFRSGGVQGGGYTVSHGTRTYLVDTAGKLRVLYPPETGSENLAADVRHLLR